MNDVQGNKEMQDKRSSNVRRYLVLWFAQLLSMLTIAITEFALGVWVYQHSGSMTLYASVILFAMVPGMLIAPWAGSIVDRFDRRRIIIIADIVYVSSVGMLGLLVWMERLELWYICLSNALASICMAFSIPAYIAATSMLVPKEHLARFSGLRQMSQAISHIVALLIAGILLAKIGLPMVIALNIPTFAFAILALLWLHFPPADIHEDGERFSLISAWNDFRAALTFVAQNPNLCLLLIYGASIAFVFSLATSLLIPMVLGLHSAVELGTILSAGGIGTLIGSTLIAVSGGHQRLVLGLIVFDLIFALSLMGTAVVKSVPMLSGLMLLSMLCAPMALGFDQTLWQKKIPLSMQGRVFSLKGIIMSGAVPIATLLGGIIADHFCEPWLQADGWLADSVGSVIGIGKGRGIAFMYLLAGSLAAILSILALAKPALRHLDRDMPDAH